MQKSSTLNGIPLGLKHLVPLAAVDATGLQSGHISPYFYSVREKAGKKLVWSHFTQYPKFAAVADTATHIILSFLATRGPNRDSTHFKTILDSLPKDIKVRHILADAGYDKEDNHIYAREVLGILTTILPTCGVPPKNLPIKYYRRLMKLNFDAAAYKQRWQIETVFSMLKRNLGYTVRAGIQINQNAEMFLLAVTHNILIVLFSFFRELFYRAIYRKYCHIKKLSVFRCCEDDSCNYITLIVITILNPLFLLKIAHWSACNYPFCCLYPHDTVCKIPR